MSNEIKVNEAYKLSDLDYKNLEALTTKLNLYLGSNRYSIIPNHIQDLAHVAIFDNNGRLVKQTNAVDIQTAVQKLVSNT